MTGPMTREAFIWAEFREMAPGRSRLPTSPGRTAEYDGPNMRAAAADAEHHDHEQDLRGVG